MSTFKSKYEENLKSGTLLIQKEFYNASVHCFYYACIQLMLHILYYVEKIDKNELNKNQKETSNEIASGFHGWIINKFATLLIPKNTQAAMEFYQWIGELKNIRVKADYKEFKVETKIAGQVKERAFYIIETLKNNFDV
ncbi:hypothetical protein [Raineya orbicola]|jgi:hypothetical protein|uniref:HEPN domain-containing protein n=1 Tax=Raineya orbicola TaxID=2016530 RepID=A0A2N3IF88_9BACT|nr:hypothetical protein [Raineya orbicola]PKQ68893.1 hypothetical protein Rain11_1548 [Raineya orbicola]